MWMKRSTKKEPSLRNSKVAYWKMQEYGPPSEDILEGRPRPPAPRKGSENALQGDHVDGARSVVVIVVLSGYP